MLSQGEGGKISLSARQANADPARRADGGTEQRRPERPAAGGRPAPRRAEPESFEEKLKQFMADSNSKISGSGQYEHRTRSRKR